MSQLAETDAAVARCFPVMAQLRRHLAEAGFVARIRQQQREGYALAFLEEKSAVVCVAGFRVLNNLAWGRFLYVDDLVTDEAHRSTGCGQQMFAWLIARAREAGCDALHLDSGVQLHPAHRFYLGQRLDITSHHFALKLK